MKEKKARGEPKGKPRKKKAGMPPSALPAPLAGAPAEIRSVVPAHPAHRGESVRVGKYEVLAGGTRDLIASDLEKADVLIPLLGSLPPLVFGREYRILAAPLVDYGGVPAEWGNFLRKQVIPLLEAGKRILAFCMGSHGRTGCFLASLISILESPAETPDPIAAARERHCEKAVESREQAEAIFALRGEPLPAQYEREFYRAPVVRHSGNGGGYSGRGHYGSHGEYDPLGYSGRWGDM